MVFDIGRIPLKDEKPKLITAMHFHCLSLEWICILVMHLHLVISDCNKINTTVDISTELVQIAGRLRMRTTRLDIIYTFYL